MNNPLGLPDTQHKGKKHSTNPFLIFAMSSLKEKHQDVFSQLPGLEKKGWMT